jgi:hypothetical protein
MLFSNMARSSAGDIVCWLEPVVCIVGNEFPVELMLGGC